MANSRIYFKSEAGGTTVVSRDTSANSGSLVLPASGNIASVDTAVTDNAIARYDSTTGKLQNSGVVIDDSGNVGIGTSNGDIFSRGYSKVVGINSTTGASSLSINATGNAAFVDLGVNGTRLGALVADTTGVNLTSVGNYPVYFGTNGNTKATLDTNGNLTINSGALRGSHGSGNIATNFAAGDGALGNNTTGINNTASGADALHNNTTGYNNTANGLNALVNNTTGYQNTASGVNALLSNTTFSHVSGFGYNSQVTGSNQVQLGDPATTTYVYGTVQNRSDLRDKADVRDTVLGLDFIKSLRPVDYKWDMREDYKTERPVAPDIEKPSEDDIEALAEYNRIQDEYKLEVEKWLEDTKLENIVKDGSKKRARYHQGFIAQEVQALGVEFGGIQDHSIKGGEDVLSIGYDEMIAPLVKAMQEMSIKMEAMQLKINELEGAK